ncbi:ComF family protein [Heyndrickxia coagulans]|uniref:ComF family protein n=1 Tax=Heyndrickxia coagulans TaxID=1398 RepID=A0AAW7CAS5_HEYCO|nr:ComF family protein [Heyndrickxia coagulans]MDL5040052.1 ComF family protein [Heyndrickxia coagulans]
MHEYCLFCHQPLTRKLSWHNLIFPQPGPLLCEDCRAQLEKIAPPVCPKCSRPLARLDASYREGDLCLDCARWEQDPEWAGVLEENISIYAYNNFCKEVFTHFKFRGDYILAAIFADGIRQASASCDFDLIVPVPLSAERLSERLFNQAEALARAAGLTPTPLLRRTHTEKQSKKTRRERIRQSQFFHVEKTAPIEGRTILLIDDIYTTGSTVHHAARALREAGAEKVYSLTAARG